MVYNKISDFYLIGHRFIYYSSSIWKKLLNIVPNSKRHLGLPLPKSETPVFLLNSYNISKSILLSFVKVLKITVLIFML